MRFYNSIGACASLLQSNVCTTRTFALSRPTYVIFPYLPMPAGIAYASILSSATAYGLMAYVNKRTNPALIATFMPLQVRRAYTSVFLRQDLLLSEGPLCCVR